MAVGGQIDRKYVKQFIDKQADRQIDREIGRQKDRQMIKYQENKLTEEKIHFN